VQYFKPEAPYYVGDCMPFFHEGTFHLFYLLDENHHQAKGGVGGHQWAHASSTDLIHWEHHPLAIPCSEDWEGSICTGSVFHHDGTFYGFYATRMLDRTEHLSLAKSRDGITFEKTLPNPFASPPKGYRSKDYRDPFVFADETTGEFHLLVTANIEDYPLYHRGGCLLRLTSKDLTQWDITEPFIIPGGMPGYPSVPECPDYFHWNGWYYLVFSLDGKAHYRMSRQPMGPWLRPPVDTLDGSAIATVMKTAAFTENRRIGVAFLSTRRDDKDNGQRLYGGNAVFREIFQRDDGSLGTKFPREMVPASGKKLDFAFTALTKGISGSADTICINAFEGYAVAMVASVPRNVRITLDVKPQANSANFGLWLRGSGNFETGYRLHCLPYEQKVTLNEQSLTRVEGLSQPFSLEVILKDDIIDVCVDQRRTVVDRCPELSGERLFFFCQNGEVAFDAIEIAPLS
jgi:beta-fructofuranosidase